LVSPGPHHERPGRRATPARPNEAPARPGSERAYTSPLSPAAPFGYACVETGSAGSSTSSGEPGVEYCLQKAIQKRGSQGVRRF
jgi:hypothetical protein